MHNTFKEYFQKTNCTQVNVTFQPYFEALKSVPAKGTTRIAFKGMAGKTVYWGHLAWRVLDYKRDAFININGSFIDQLFIN